MNLLDCWITAGLSGGITTQLKKNNLAWGKIFWSGGQPLGRCLRCHGPRSAFLSFSYLAHFFFTILSLKIVSYNTIIHTVVCSVILKLKRTYFASSSLIQLKYYYKYFGSHEVFLFVTDLLEIYDYQWNLWI